MLSSSSIYVAPQTGGESFGIVLLEAMAAGAAVVASDLESFRDWAGETALFFPVGNSEALAMAVLDLLEDTGRRQSLADRRARLAEDTRLEHCRRYLSGPLRRGGRLGQPGRGGTIGVPQWSREKWKPARSRQEGLAEMLKGGVIMDVVNAEQAQDRRGGRRRRRDGARARPGRHPHATAASRAWPIPTMIEEIQDAVTIPVMAKCRIGHFAEAQVLQALEVDYIDESEVLTPADDEHHVDKCAFTVPFVCGARNLGEALRRIGEGAAMIRTKGEAGTGNIVEAVRHMRTVTRRDPRARARCARRSCYVRGQGARRALRARPRGRRERQAAGRQLRRRRHRHAGRRRAVMQLGADGVFVGSGIFKSGDPRPARGRSSRRRRSGTSPKWWPRSPAVSARPCRGSRSTPSGTRSVSPSEAGEMTTVGVLALQGDVREHLHTLESLGVAAAPIKTPDQLGSVDALVIPGGESTTIGKMAVRFGLLEPTAAIDRRRAPHLRHLCRADPAGRRRHRGRPAACLASWT